MSEIITCPDCDTRLKMKAALPPGKKVRCPKCSTLFAPVSEEQAETSVSERRRNTVAEREEEEDERPRRRLRSAVEKEDAEELEDAERPRRSRKKRPRKSGSIPLIVWLMIGGGVLLLVVGAGIVVAVMAVRGRADPYKENEAAVKELLTSFDEFATTLESIKDRQSAKTGVERINKICDRMEKVIARIELLPKLTPAQNERLRNDVQPRIDACIQRIARVSLQVRTVTQGDPTFQAALQRIQQISTKLQQINK